MNYICLIGDLGGTNVRFEQIEVTVQQNKATKTKLHSSAKLLSRNQPSMEELIQEFLEGKLRITKKDNLWPTVACICVAGPIEGSGRDQHAKITNLKFTVRVKDIEDTLDIKICRILNDFSGAGYGILNLEPHQYIQINNAKPKVGRPIAVIGPGTGLGEAFLTPVPRRVNQILIDSTSSNDYEYTVFPSEGGHCTFASQTPEQYGLLEYIRKERGIQHISYEQVCAGIGLPSIYKYLSGIPPEKSNDKKYQYITPSFINNNAENGKDEVAIRAMDIFLDILATEVGNAILKYLPLSGFYIAGGISAKILWAIRKPAFFKALMNKGRMKSIIQDTPIYVVLVDELGLLGSRLYCTRICSELYELKNDKLTSRL